MASFLSYFITDPSYSLQQIKEAIKKHKPTFVCYRNKEYFDKNEIMDFANFAKNYSKVFINLDSLKDDSLLEHFDGVHIPSSRLDEITEYKNKIIIASTHNPLEVQKAQKADYITFSPIFKSKNRCGLGTEVLNHICNMHPKVIALGGIISDKEVEKIKNTKAVGFGSIRYFFT
ncbi:thiamine phosphate synthase [Caminibacter pacificus]|uniref:Thiamine phosphate synthase n=1 Tax=Caminibacter pacificus TaxID=1424653 RepID=A0AAJ4RC79_9BACT|nr:thiamine phosphate synthase [Caminibacter pacificus]QCI28920.1 thiamine phosphate synthase [Caminibacter pacificus]ROR39511.1 thiamine-phosphate pyrophosphorylase [Caminibacter pacificus]